MSTPDWFSAIHWSTPLPIEELRVKRHLLPKSPGVYVFTNYAGPLEKSTGVLYVGKAASLFLRVQSYLADPAAMLVLSPRSGRVSSSLKHAGKSQLLVELQQKSRGAGASGIWVRWVAAPSPHLLEAQLLVYLRPAFNTQGI
jgi:hypothetical protein